MLIFHVLCAGSLPPGTVVVYLGTTAAAPWLTSFDLPSGCLDGWEAHCVSAFTAGSPGTNGYASIVATGVGLRGAIFGAYTFTDVVLGFKPLYLFTDTPTYYNPGLTVNDTLSVVYSPPQYTYRSFFVNDEDLTGTHRQDPLGKNVFDVAAWDVLFQTALRMKANMILVGTNPFPDDTATALAARRGLVVSHHHYNLLGGNVFSWPFAASDWNLDTDWGTMAYMWRSAIAAQANYPEVVWSVGLRGLNDEAYSCKGDRECGQAISNAIGNQTNWVRSTPGQANATTMLYMWDELLQLLSEGVLDIPAGTTVVFTDAGDGYVRTDANWTQYAEGCYYHTAMYNYVANQLTEMVPVSRIAEQLVNVVAKSKATKVFVLNLSDLKPVPMTTAAVFDLVWNSQPWNATQDFNATARAWYSKFGQDYAGLTDASSLTTYAAMWEAYFNIPYIWNGNSDNMLANDIGSVGKDMAMDWEHGQGVTTASLKQAQDNVAATGGAAVQAQLAALNATAWALLPSVPYARRGFYTSHVLVQFGLQLASMTAIVNLAAAAQLLLGSNGNAPDPTPAIPLVQAALDSLDQLMALRRVTEGDASAWAGLGPDQAAVNIGQAYPLRSYYLADQLSDMQWARGAVRALLMGLQAPPKTRAFPIRANTWYLFEGYQAENAANYPYVSFNPAWNMPTYVRSNCRASDVSAGKCLCGPDGGWFVKSSGAALTLQVMQSQTGEEPHEATRQAMAKLTAGRHLLANDARDSQVQADAPALVIRYTADGTVPTTSSPAYNPGQPPVLAQLLPTGQTSVTIKAMGWVDGVPTGQVTTTVWVAK